MFILKKFVKNDALQMHLRRDLVVADESYFQQSLAAAIYWKLKAWHCRRSNTGAFLEQLPTQIQHPQPQFVTSLTQN